MAKLVDILARELVEWPEGASHAVVDTAGTEREVALCFTTGGPPKWQDTLAFSILGDDVPASVFWHSFSTPGAFGLKSSPSAICSYESWKAARATYLSSIHPGRDADIEPEKKPPYAFTEADIRAAFEAGANWMHGAVKDGAAEYVDKLKGVV